MKIGSNRLAVGIVLVGALVVLAIVTGQHVASHPVFGRIDHSMMADLGYRTEVRKAFRRAANLLPGGKYPERLKLGTNELYWAFHDNRAKTGAILFHVPYRVQMTG